MADAPSDRDDVRERTVPSRPGRSVTVYSEYEHGPHDYGRISAAIQRISWGAIFAGGVVAVITQVLLNLLGLGIGLTTFEFASSDDSASGFGITQAIWTVVSALIALFVGGWVAGRLAGMPRKTDGMLHGVVTWALTTLLTLFLLGSGIGGLVSSAFNVLGQGVQLAGQGVSAAVPQGAIEDAVQNVGLGDIQREIQQLLRDTDDPALSPDSLAEAMAQGADAAGSAAAEADLQAALNRAFDQFGRITSEADRDDLVNVIVARTSLSEAEARTVVGEWEGRLSDLRAEAVGQYEIARERAPEIAADVADAVGTAAIVAFFALLLGAIAAAVGGSIGSPEDLPAEAVYRADAPHGEVY